MSGRVAMQSAFLIAMAACAPADAADVLASGATYGGPTQNVVICRFTNTSGASKVISNYGIAAASGLAIPARTSSCGRGEPFALPARGSCFIGASVASNEAYVCRATFADKSGMRGTVEVVDAAGSVLVTLAMR
jgi:hypothetical protein